MNNGGDIDDDITVSELSGLASLQAGAGADKHAYTLKDVVAPTEHPAVEDCHAKLNHWSPGDRDRSGRVPAGARSMLTGINASPEQMMCT
jgi:hypothetical protein